MNQFITYPCQSSQHMKFINRSLSSNKRLPVWFYVVGWSSDVHVSEILAYCKIWNGINIREISSCRQLLHTQNIFWSINYRGICTLSDWSRFPQILRVKKILCSTKESATKKQQQPVQSTCINFIICSPKLCWIFLHLYRQRSLCDTNPNRSNSHTNYKL